MNVINHLVKPRDTKEYNYTKGNILEIDYTVQFFMGIIFFVWTIPNTAIVAVMWMSYYIATTFGTEQIILDL